MRSEPIRMCIACRKRNSKYRLLRFVVKDGQLFFDPDYKAFGRGANVCPSHSCLKKAFNKNLFERALKTKVALPASYEDFIKNILSVIRDRIVNGVRMGLKFRGVVSGREAVKRYLNKEEVSLLIIAEDLSERSIAEFEGLAVDRCFLLTKDEWGAVLGRVPVGIIGIIDEGLARKLKLLIEKYVSLNKRGSLNGKK